MHAVWRWLKFSRVITAAEATWRPWAGCVDLGAPNRCRLEINAFTGPDSPSLSWGNNHDGHGARYFRRDKSREKGIMWKTFFCTRDQFDKS